MAGLRDPLRYREEAARFIEMAERAEDSSELRDSYLALAASYERLADALERSELANQIGGRSTPPRVYTGQGRPARSQGRQQL